MNARPTSPRSTGSQRRRSSSNSKNAVAPRAEVWREPPPPQQEEAVDVAPNHGSAIGSNNNGFPLTSPPMHHHHHHQQQHRDPPAKPQEPQQYKTAIVPISSNGSTVSEVTDPTYFQNEKTTAAAIQHAVAMAAREQRDPKGRLTTDTTITSGSAMDAAFDINSPVFSTGDPFRSPLQQQPMQQEEEAMAAPSKSEDEFSDPFFQAAPTDESGSGVRRQVV